MAHRCSARERKQRRQGAYHRPHRSEQVSRKLEQKLLSNRQPLRVDHSGSNFRSLTSRRAEAILRLAQLDATRVSGLFGPERHDQVVSQPGL